MRVVVISDTHNLHKHFLPLPYADMIIHCGDMTTHGKPSEFMEFHKWWSSLEYKHKIIIPGNHDRCIDLDPSLGDMLRQAGHFLLDSSVTIDGILFHGSPWVLRFGPFPFMMDEGEELAKKWTLIPENTDVLITHGPPHGIRDFVNKKNGFTGNVGSTSLLEAVMKIKPQVHVFGHIHEGYGTEEKNDILFINAANHTGLWRGPRSPYKECEERPPILFEVSARKAN